MITAIYRRLTGRILLLAFIFMPLTFSAYAANIKHPSELTYPQLEFNPPETKRVVLKNGMVLHLLENHELPLVEMESLVRIGSLYEPDEKTGLASLTGATWRSGGTRSYEPARLDEKLAFIGAVMETSIGGESGSLSLSLLKRDLDEGLRYFADLIMNPVFDEKRFSIAKNRMIEGIKRQNDNPRDIVKREFMKKLMSGHPRGRFPTNETLGRISREDCERFYKDHVGPESFIIGISGDFDSADIVVRFEKLFGDFKPAKNKLPSLRPLPDKIKPGVYIVDKKVPQTVLRMGHIGVSRKDPDYYAVRVMNFVLGGGGFSSRLMQEIRSTRGLAYSVWSYYFGGNDQKGVFITGGETKASSTGEFVEVSRDIMRQIIKDGVTKEELGLAKESIINSFVFAFDKDSKIVSRYLWIEYYDLPRDYLKTFRDNIRSVTMETARDAADKYLHPEKMIVFMVGDRNAMGELSTLPGEVEVIDLDN